MVVKWSYEPMGKSNAPSHATPPPPSPVSNPPVVPPPQSPLRTCSFSAWVVVVVFIILYYIYNNYYYYITHIYRLLLFIDNKIWAKIWPMWRQWVSSLAI